MTNTVAGAAVSTWGDQVRAAIYSQAGNEGALIKQVADWVVTNGVSFVVNAVFTILILIAGWLAIRLIVGAVGRAVELRYKGDQLFPRLVMSVTRKVLWAFLIVTVIQRLGVNIAPILAGLGVTGFIVGFACQESLANLAAGVMIAINQPFRVGQFVEVAGLSGNVCELSMMATTLTTPDNKLVVVPNKAVWGSSIVNYSALPTRRVDLKVGVAYGADLPKAIQVIMDTLKNSKLVLVDPAPTVAVVELSPNAVSLTVRPWVKSEDYWTTFFEMTQAVKVALDQNGIELPLPQKDVPVKQLPQV